LLACVQESVVSSALDEMLAEHKDEKGTLIPILQKVQQEFGYLSPEAISEVSRFTGYSENEIFGVSSESVTNILANTALDTIAKIPESKVCAVRIEGVHKK